MFKCTNCSWGGDGPKGNKFCPICGDNVVILTTNVEKLIEPIIEEPIKKTLVKKKTSKKK